MTNHLQQFIDAMRAAGVGPQRDSEVIASERVRRYTIEGDKANSKNGWYVYYDGECPGGKFGSWKHGIEQSWSARVSRQFTQEEKAAWKKKRDAEQAQRKKQESAMHEDAAQRAARIWSKAERQGTTPYLDAKQITIETARIYKNVLIVPVMIGGKVWSLQFVSKDGEKRFLKGGRIQGGYCPLTTAKEAKDTIYIAEGYATAKTIREATGKPVLCAFNAKNLIAVAQEMRRKYPQAHIIICADNDADTVINGKPHNTGIESAKQAAVRAKAVMIWPEQSGDFNDLHVSQGLDAVKNRLAQVVCQEQPSAPAPDLPTGVTASPDVGGGNDIPNWINEAPPLEAYEEDAREMIGLYHVPEVKQDDESWRGELHYNDKGHMTAKSMNNTRLILQHSEAFREMFCYDEFAHEKMVVQCPPWASAKGFKPRPVEDEDITALACSLEKLGLTLKLTELRKVFDMVVMKRRRNPAREYFNKLEWDGKERLATWLQYYAGCEKDPMDYLSWVGTKWMVAAVRRAKRPGTKFDHMLVLEGGQRVGKSTLLRRLATIHGHEYFDDTLKVSDLGQDRSVPKLQGVLIVELQEMSGLGKTDAQILKQAISTQSDRIVRKYANEPKAYPRQFVLAGTYNPMAGVGYLDDPTGLSRFWPVTVGDNIDVDALEHDKEQLWAEAAHLDAQGYPIWLDREQERAADAVRDARKIVDPWMPEIESAVRGYDFVTSGDVWAAVGLEKGRRSNREAQVINKIMAELGFEYTRKSGGDRQYGWRKM